MTDGSRYYVLVGDLIGSKRLVDQRDSVQQKLKNLVRTLAGTGGSTRALAAVSRGDALEAFTDSPEQLILFLWEVSKVFPREIRIGVGVGGIETFSEDVNEMDGPAFHAARLALDAIPKRSRTATSEPIKVLGLAPAATTVADGLMALLWHVYRSLTPSQFEVVEELRAGKEQGEIARDVGVSPSALSKRARSSGADTILRAERALTVFFGEQNRPGAGT